MNYMMLAAVAVAVFGIASASTFNCYVCDTVSTAATVDLCNPQQSELEDSSLPSVTTAQITANAVLAKSSDTTCTACKDTVGRSKSGTIISIDNIKRECITGGTTCAGTAYADNDDQVICYTSDMANKVVYLPVESGVSAVTAGITTIAISLFFSKM